MGPAAPDEPSSAPGVITVVRRLMLAVLLLGMIGLLAELYLTGHYEDIKQQIPLVLLAAGLGAVFLDLLTPARWSQAVLQMMMALFIAAGLLGMFFHFQGSRDFQREMDPGMAGLDLVWHVLRAKSPPTLAPGTMVQMGLLGLGYAYLRRRR